MMQILNMMLDFFRIHNMIYVNEGKHNLVIGIGCTGGKHRSVTIVNALYERLKQLDEYGVKAEHRDIRKDSAAK